MEERNTKCMATKEGNCWRFAAPTREQKSKSVVHGASPFSKQMENIEYTTHQPFGAAGR